MDLIAKITVAHAIGGGQHFEQFIIAGSQQGQALIALSGWPSRTAWAIFSQRLASGSKWRDGKDRR